MAELSIHVALFMWYDFRSIYRQTYPAIVDIVPAGSLVGPVQQKQIWGRKAHNFGWAIFGWARYITVTRARASARARPPSTLIPTLIDLWVTNLVSRPVW